MNGHEQNNADSMPRANDERSTPDTPGTTPPDGAERTPDVDPPASGERRARRRDGTRAAQMVKNLGTNFLTIGVQLLLGLFLTRYLIRTLGPAEYAAVPLSTQLMNFFSLVTLTVNSSVGRFLTMQLARGELDEAKRTFNSSFWGMMLVYSVLIPIAAVIAWFSPQIFHFAEGAEEASRRVMIAVMYSFFTLVAAGTLNVAIFARNRLDLLNYVRMVWHFVRVGTPFILIGWFGWGLDGVSVGIVLSSTLNFWWSVYLWRKMNPELTLAPRLFSRQRFGEMFSMSIWLMMDKIGRILHYAGTIIVVNLVLGPAAAGKFGAILVFVRTVTLFNRSMRRVATPVTYQLFGENRPEAVRRFLVSFVRFQGILMAVPLGLLLLLAEPILQIWLGKKFIDLAPVLQWMMVGLILTIPMVPVRSIFPAKKKVMEPGILSLTIGLVNVGLSVWLLDPNWGLGLGLVSVPIAGLLTTQLKNFFYVPLYAAHLMNDRWYVYFRPLIRITAAYIFLLGVTWGIGFIIDPYTWWGLLLTGAIVTVVYLPMGIFVFLTKQDRNRVREMRRLRRKRRPEDADEMMDDDTGEF